MFEQFKKMCDDYGFTIQPVGAMVNDIWITRPDIVSVRYNGFHVMTAPTKMYAQKNTKHKTIDGIEHPSFYDLEYNLRSVKMSIERLPILQERERKEREIIRLEKNK